MWRILCVRPVRGLVPIVPTQLNVHLVWIPSTSIKLTEPVSTAINLVKLAITTNTAKHASPVISWKTTRVIPVMKAATLVH